MSLRVKTVRLVSGSPAAFLRRVIQDLRREGSRRSLFEDLDQPVLPPLPPERYHYGDSAVAPVNIDDHIVFDQHFYSA